MYCGKCGTEVSNGVVFCPNCGQQIYAQTPVGQATQQSNKSKRVKIWIPAVLLIAVIVIAAVVILASKGSYEKTLDHYYEAIETQDAELMRSTLAQYWIDYQVADYDTDAYLEGDIEDIIDDYRDEFECGDDIEITYSVTGEKEANDSDLEALKDNIYDWYAYYIYDKDEFDRSITDAKVVTVRLKVTGNENMDIFTSKLLLIQENGEWKVTIGGLDNSFYSNY